MKFKDINNLVHHKELTSQDLPRGYEVLEEGEDGTSLTIVNRVQYITKQYGLEYILNKNNTITKADVFKLGKAYQLQFPVLDNTTTKLYIIQRRYIQITDPRNGNEYEKFDYILTEMEEIKKDNPTTDIDGVLIDHYIRIPFFKEFEIIYSTFKNRKRKNDYQTFKLTFEQFESLIKK